MVTETPATLGYAMEMLAVLAHDNVPGMHLKPAEAVLIEAELTALRVAFEAECRDIDLIVEAIGIPADRARTEGGSLLVARIKNHIRETLDELANANERANAFTHKYADAAKECEALRARAEAAEKDAERYRWLRKGGYPLSEISDAAIDAAIDRARGADGEGE